MEREIGNVAAEVGLRAFRYLSFAPVTFDLPPVPPPTEVPSAAETGVHDAHTHGQPPHDLGETTGNTLDLDAPHPAAGRLTTPVGGASHLPAPNPMAAAAMEPPAPGGEAFALETPGWAKPIEVAHAAPPPPTRPAAREAFADGLPGFAFTALPAPGGSPVSGKAEDPARGLFAPTPAAPSFTPLAQVMPAPAFVMASPSAWAGVTPAPATPLPATPITPPAPALPYGTPPLPPLALNPFAAAPVAPAEAAAPRLRRIAELQAEVPPARAATRAASPRHYAMLQDVQSELAGRAPPAPSRRDLPA